MLYKSLKMTILEGMEVFWTLLAVWPWASNSLTLLPDLQNELYLHRRVVVRIKRYVCKVFGPVMVHYKHSIYTSSTEKSGV